MYVVYYLFSISEKNTISYIFSVTRARQQPIRLKTRANTMRYHVPGVRQ